MADDTEKTKKGLEHVDDETLAAIVESEITEDGKLSYHGQVAFAELANRTPSMQH